MNGYCNNAAMSATWAYAGTVFMHCDPSDRYGLKTSRQLIKTKQWYHVYKIAKHSGEFLLIINSLPAKMLSDVH